MGRYSTPADATFTNTYVPIPFEEIVQAGRQRQGKQDAQVQALEEAQSAYDELSSIADSEDRRYIEEIQEDISNMATGYVGQDLTRKSVATNIRKTLNSYDKRRINDIQESALNYKNAALAKSAMGTKAPDFLNDLSGEGYDSRTGVYSKQPEALLNWEAKAGGFFTGMKDSFMYAGNVSKEDHMRGVFKGIDEKRIRAHAKSNAGNFLASNEGAQFKKKLISEGFAPEEFEQEAEDYLYQIGTVLVHEGASSTYLDPEYVEEQERKKIAAKTQIPDYNSGNYIGESSSFGKEFNKFSKVRKTVEKQREELDDIDRQIKEQTEKKTPEGDAAAVTLGQEKASIMATNKVMVDHYDRFEADYYEGKEKGPDYVVQDFLETIPEAFPDIPKDLVPSIEATFRVMKEQDVSFEVAYGLMNIPENQKNPEWYAPSWETLIPAYGPAKFGWKNAEAAGAFVEGMVQPRLQFQRDFQEESQTAIAPGGNVAVTKSALLTTIGKELRGLGHAYTAAYNKDDKAKTTYIKSKWENELPKGDHITGKVLPVMSENGTIKIPGTNKRVANPMEATFKSWKLNPATMDLRTISGKKLSPSKEAASRSQITTVKSNKGKLVFNAAGTFDSEGPFVVATLLNKVGTFMQDYSVKLDDAASRNMAFTFALLGDIKTAFKFSNPRLSQDIATQFDKANLPETTSFNILDETLSFTLDEGREFYNVVDTRGYEFTVAADGSIIESKMYSIYRDSATHLRENTQAAE